MSIKTKAKKRLGWVLFILLALALLTLAGTFGLVVGRAQVPRAEPTPVAVPPPIVSSPTPEEPLETGEPGLGSLTGRVWHDVCAVAGGEGGVAGTPSEGCLPAGDGTYRANGLVEAAEAGIDGVLVQLGAGPCPAAGLAVATTDATGVYAFAGLNEGTYCVSVDALKPENASLLPGSWTAPLVGVPFYSLPLGEGEQKDELNFGWDYQLLPVPEPPAPEPGTEPAPALTCADRAAFVSDVTIPDGMYVPAGQPFIKTWRLRNAGTCTWTTNYALVFVAGHRIGGPLSVPLSHPVAPDETVDLSVTLVAPSVNDAYEGKWQLRNAAGRAFGSGGVADADGAFWVRIVIGHASSGWRGEYYGNRDLAGAPALVRSDGEIHFDWGPAAPIAGVPADGFSVRWTRNVPFKGGSYRFYSYGDDGMRVWLDGVLIIDQWHEATGVTYAAERTLSEGGHAIRVEYYEEAGAARIRFWWQHLDEFPQWRADYFPNIELSGNPMLTRNDPSIDYDWSRYAPAAGGLPTDRFSVRWRRVLAFEEGWYRFHAVVDDGVRLWVDGMPIIDAWDEGAVRDVTGDVWLPTGTHALRIEYFELTGEAQIQVWWEKLGN